MPNWVQVPDNWVVAGVEPNLIAFFPYYGDKGRRLSNVILQFDVARVRCMLKTIPLSRCLTRLFDTVLSIQTSLRDDTKGWQG